MEKHKIENIIKNSFDPFFNAPIEVWKSFSSLGEVIRTTKDQIIKPAGKKERFLSSIIEGSGGVLLWNISNFVCIDLFYSGEFFGDYMSFLTEQMN